MLSFPSDEFNHRFYSSYRTGIALAVCSFVEENLGMLFDERSFSGVRFRVGDRLFK